MDGVFIFAKLNYSCAATLSLFVSYIYLNVICTGSPDTAVWSAITITSPRRELVQS